MSEHDTDGNESTDETVDCPSCDRSFSTENGMKSHHVQIHGESLYGVEVTCPECGEEVTKPRNEVEEAENNFCSQSCRSKYNAPTKDEEKWTVLECDNCGDEFEKRLYRVGRYRRQFCSRECKDEFHSEDIAGEDHPNWVGGTSDIRYGPRWTEQRERCLERDGYQCVVCSMTNEEHKEWTGHSLHVHHIIPRSAYLTDDGIDHEKANRLENLVALCHRCHKRWEGIPLRPDRG